MRKHGTWHLAGTWQWTLHKLHSFNSLRWLFSLVELDANYVYTGLDDVYQRTVLNPASETQKIARESSLGSPEGVAQVCGA